MYYFKYNDTCIEKYVVRFNRDELIALRHKIITNCSELVHREVDTNEELSNNSKIRNLKKEKKNSMYHYSYDEYIYPHLVSIIDTLLRNDDRVIEEISCYEQKYLDNVTDMEKRAKLVEYYSRLENMLSFELLITIDLNEPEDSKHHGRKIRRISYARNKKR